MKASSFAVLCIAASLPAFCQTRAVPPPLPSQPLTSAQAALDSVPTGAFQYLEASLVQGHLIVTGFVNSSVLRNWALSSVRDAAPGVPVDDRIVVSPRGALDFALEQREWKKLEADSWLEPLFESDHPAVRITSQNGRIDLWGAVDNEGQKAVLELLANSVDGVAGVWDHTVVLHPLTDVAE